MKLTVCIEIEMPSTLCKELEKSDLTLGDVEDALCKDINKATNDLLPLDCSVVDCYASGWDI